jgi:phage terminase small subunit
VVETEKGPKRNPIAVEMLAQQTVVNKLANELGLSPSGRARLTVEPTTENDPFLEWLAEGKSEN